MTEPELDPRIERPHSYIISFASVASCWKAAHWLDLIGDHFMMIKPTMLAITVGLNKVDLTYVITREGAFNFQIKEIDGFEIVDTRTEEERLNDILDLISKSGYEIVPIEDRLFLRGLAEKSAEFA